MRHTKKAKRRFSLTLVSVSSRINLGSRRPARAKSTSTLGSVAEKSSVWRASGTPRMMSWICSANPISKSRSASSNTTTSTMPREKSCSSVRWCARRPGVAMMMSGLLDSAAHCASMPSPPTMRHTRRLVKLHSARAKRSVWEASSRVGESTSARAPAMDVCALRRLTTGTRKDAVLPEPVRAIATRSWPSSATGMVLRCTGVGRR